MHPLVTQGRDHSLKSRYFLHPRSSFQEDTVLIAKDSRHIQLPKNTPSTPGPGAIKGIAKIDESRDTTLPGIVENGRNARNYREYRPVQLYEIV